MDNLSPFLNNKPEISESSFKKVSSFIHQNFGIKLPPEKKVMLEGRLLKRLSALGYTDYTSYVDFVFSDAGMTEMVHMIDQITTNKTDFFRESGHFDFLFNELMPQYIEEQKELDIWSAASSTGEEIYTIAIVLEEFFRKNGRSIPYSIYGSDLSTKVLKLAHNAIYANDRIAPVAQELLKRYFLKGKGDNEGTVRVKPQLREKVSFFRLNLMEIPYKVPKPMDIIFCRNVLIYFNRIDQNKVIKALIDQLKPGGYLFIGHSESLGNHNFPITMLKPTIFRKDL